MGSRIALLAPDGAHYWTANGDPNDVSGTPIGAAQTFELARNTQ